MRKRDGALGLIALVLLLLVVLWQPWRSDDSGGRVGDETDVISDPADVSTNTEQQGAESKDAVREVEAEKEKPPSKVPGRLRVQVVWHDGKAAPDVAILCRGVYPVLLPGGTRRAISDAEGLAVFDGLPVGKLALFAIRGGSAKAEVFADRESEAKLKVDRGVDVEGIVVDPQGEPVAGAGVWMTSRYYRDWLGGRIAARAGDDGRFRVRSVMKGQSLGAIATGYERSALIDLDTVDVSKPPVQLRLELAPGGGSVRVRVVDEAQEPLGGALVAIGTMPRRFKQRSGMAYVETWTPQVIECDTDGWVVAHGLPPGEHPMAAKHDRTAIWTGRVTVETGRTTEKIVTIGTPVVVHGIVRDDSGIPVSRAAIRAVPEEFDEVYMQTGQFDYEAVFGYPMTTASRDGRYRLTTVAPGQVHLHAQMPRKSRRREALYRAKKSLVVDAGATIEWNPVLGAGHAIKGKVTFQCGTPMGHVFVTARELESGKRRVTTSSKDGRFRLVNLTSCAHTVRVQLWSPPKGPRWIVQTDVWPDQAELRMAAEYDAPVKHEPASVRGRVLDAAKRVTNKSALMVLLCQKSSWRTDEDLEDGTFEFKDIQPGRYKLVVKCGEIVLYEGDWFQLVPGAAHDAGVLRTAMAGSIVVRVKRGPGTEDLDLTVYLTPAGGTRSSRLDLGKASTLRSDNISTGRYRVRMLGKGIVTGETELNIPAGGVAHVDLGIEAGVLAKLRLHLPADIAEGSLRIRVTDAGGKTVHEYTGRDLQSLPRPWSIWRYLPPGQYTLRAEGPAGLRGSKTFELKKLGAEVIVDLELR